MTDAEQRERALDEASRMRMLASRYRQMGVKALARFLKENADAAMKWSGLEKLHE